MRDIVNNNKNLYFFNGITEQKIKKFLKLRHYQKMTIEMNGAL